VIEGIKLRTMISSDMTIVASRCRCFLDGRGVGDVDGWKRGGSVVVKKKRKEGALGRVLYARKDNK
jgi:hypothetical protein